MTISVGLVLQLFEKLSRFFAQCQWRVVQTMKEWTLRDTPNHWRISANQETAGVLARFCGPDG